MLKLLIFRCTRYSDSGVHSDQFILHINKRVVALAALARFDLDERHLARVGVLRNEVDLAAPALREVAVRGEPVRGELLGRRALEDGTVVDRRALPARDPSSGLRGDPSSPSTLPPEHTAPYLWNQRKYNHDCPLSAAEYNRIST